MSVRDNEYWFVIRARSGKTNVAGRMHHYPDFLKESGSLAPSPCSLGNGDADC